MPAKDRFHDTVCHALKKEGWVITDDPLSLSWGDVDLYVDLGAEKILMAQKDKCKIAVEIKSFIALSVVSEFHTAVGQYIDYQIALEEDQPNRKLYLAIPNDIYCSFFQRQFTKKVIEKQNIHLIVYDIEQEVIIKWH